MRRPPPRSTLFPYTTLFRSIISEMLDLGARPLWVAKQTGTSLEMIENHYRRPRDTADELDQLIGDQTNVNPKGNPGGTLSVRPRPKAVSSGAITPKALDLPGLSMR